MAERVVAAHLKPQNDPQGTLASRTLQYVQKDFQKRHPVSVLKTCSIQHHIATTEKKRYDEEV